MTPEDIVTILLDVKVEITEDAVFRRVTPAAVIRCAEAHGWRQIAENNVFYCFEQMPPLHPFGTLMVPKDPDSADYAARMREVVVHLSDCHEISQLHILMELLAF